MVIHGYRMALIAWVLASTPGYADIHKCRQGERVIYQSDPCPTGSVSLPPPSAPTRPSAYAVEEARHRAKNDISEAEALIKREDNAAKAREKARATTRKQETDCARLRDKIEQAQAKEESRKSQKSTLKSAQSKYRKLCGPL